MERASTNSLDIAGATRREKQRAADNACNLDRNARSAAAPVEAVDEVLRRFRHGRGMDEAALLPRRHSSPATRPYAAQPSMRRMLKDAARSLIAIDMPRIFPPSARKLHGLFCSRFRIRPSGLSECEPPEKRRAS
jgi:hypothetical protein